MFKLFKRSAVAHHHKLVAMRLSMDIPSSEHVKFFETISPKGYYEELLKHSGINGSLEPSMFQRSYVELVMDEKAFEKMQKVNSKALSKRGHILQKISEYGTLPSIEEGNVLVFVNPTYEQFTFVLYDSQTGSRSLKTMHLPCNSWDDLSEILEGCSDLDDIKDFFSEFYKQEGNSVGFKYVIMNNFSPYLQCAGDYPVVTLDVNHYCRRAELWGIVANEFHDVLDSDTYDKFFGAGNPYE